MPNLPDDAATPMGRRAERYWRHVAWACGITWVVLATVVGTQAWRDALHLKVEALHAAVDLGAIALEANFNRNARALEAALDREFGVAPDLDAKRWQRVVLAVKTTVPTLADVSFVRTDGVVIASTSRRLDIEGTVPAQSATFEAFLKGISRGRSLYLGRTYLNSETKRWMIPLRLVVRDEGKTVLGALVANTAVTEFGDAWRQMDLTRSAALGVIGDDGYLRAAYPRLNNASEEEVYSVARDGTLIRHLREHDFPLHGHVLGDTGSGRIRTLAVFHRMQDYPATFFAQLPLVQIAHQWWEGFRQALAVLVLLGLAVAYGLHRVIRAEHHWFDAQRRSESARATIRDLSNRLVNAEEEERRRLAIDLHDDLGQVLTATKITLQSQLSAPVEDAREMCQQSIDMVAQALETVRSLSRELRPSILDDLGLAHAVRWQAERVQAQTGLKVDVTGDFPGRLPPEVEIHGYRVVHQALVNVQRHAKAQHVSIQLDATPTHVSIAIRDDGVGFDVDEALHRARAGDSLGLLGMQQRAHWLQGELTIDSKPGAGTSIVLRMPVSGPSGTVSA